MKYIHTYKRTGIFPLLLIILSCSDFVAIEPPRNEITTETVFTDDASAISAMSGIYSAMSEPGGFISGTAESIAVLGGLSSDEFIHLSTNLSRDQFFHNAILSDNNMLLNAVWQPAYTFIYYCNSLLEGLESATGITRETRQQLEGEARFIRGFCYFYLVNLFGEVPIITTTDFEKNRLAPRDPVAVVYEHIQNDLELAEKLLPEDYTHANGERIRPNKTTATAMLARVYLFTGDWIQAGTRATQVINNPAYHLVPDLNKVFLANSEEAIWQLWPVERNNTSEAAVFIPANETSRPTFVSLTWPLMDAFEENDYRKTYWTGEIVATTGETFHFPAKYKVRDANMPSTEYAMVLRLAEQYLIRAEARAQQGNIPGALADINAVRTRTGLEEITLRSPEELLGAILRERQVELFSEGAHRWLDLKRTGQADAILKPVKTDWQATDVLYPVPQQERASNPNLSQNEGY
ncbi:RagB/SusD family nutrient uptake outer membrane protein [Sinomicrobium sp. M5D2P9]